MYINIGDKTVNNVSIGIFNIQTGSQVLGQQLHGQSGVLSLDVANIPLGAYFLRLVLDGEVTVYKISK